MRALKTRGYPFVSKRHHFETTSWMVASKRHPFETTSWMVDIPNRTADAYRHEEAGDSVSQESSSPCQSKS
ncbi:hypothetical protein GQ600_3607 [Phytophthora cactorum]|nr:hypothetical protein GQ600_3607 [Phytophthora cactorum]